MVRMPLLGPRKRMKGELAELCAGGLGELARLNALRNAAALCWPEVCRPGQRTGGIAGPLPRGRARESEVSR